MTIAQRGDGNSPARLRLVASDSVATNTAQDEQDQLESELALERRQMRRDLAAKLLDEHHKKLAKKGAARSALVSRQAESRNESGGQTCSTLDLVSKGLQQKAATRLAKRESHLTRS